MTPEDRELLLQLRRQQADLHLILGRLDLQLRELESRHVESMGLPPIPEEIELPPIPTLTDFPPLPVATPPPFAPALPPVPQPSFEFHLGRWLTRIGVVLFVLAALSIDGYFHLHRLLGPWGQLSLGAVTALLVAWYGQRIERKRPERKALGRTFLLAGLAGLYACFYAATHASGWQVITEPVLGGLLLLWTAVYFLFLAERKNSQILAVMALALAYIGTAMNPVASFTLRADMFLAITAALILARRGWTVFAFVALIATYLAVLRDLVIDENGDLVLDTSRTLEFAPYAIYIIAAWVIFTIGMVLTEVPTFRGKRRLAFLSLNNAALAILLFLATYIAGYGHGPQGWALLGTGLALLVTSRFVGWAQHEPDRIMAAYAAQGLALLTLGIIGVFTGVTRGVLLLVETLFFGAAGAFSGDRVLKFATYAAAFFATFFLAWEIEINAHHPWLLGFGGAFVMLLNAWWARSDVRHSPKSHRTFVLSSFGYSVLTVVLMFVGLTVFLNADSLPAGLALSGVALTLLIYVLVIYELPPLAQILVLAAQILVLFPVESGEDLPWWSTALVAAATLFLLTWWTRQRAVQTGAGTTVLKLVYALSLFGVTCQAVRPWVDDQGWMIAACLLSLVYLAWGMWTRVWAIAIIGQLFLALAVEHFFFPPGGWELHRLGWHAWAAIVPIAVVFGIGHAGSKWLRIAPGIPSAWRGPLHAVASCYLLVALAMTIRWVAAVITPLDQVPTFLLLGALLLAWNVLYTSLFGVRCSFVLTAIGLWLYVALLGAHAREMATGLTALAFLGFLLQPSLLGDPERPLVTWLENRALLIFAIAGSWLFTSVWVETRWHAGCLTLGWALFALCLFVLGLLSADRRPRWCGIAILIAAVLRVLCVDLWGLSTGYRVLTLVGLTLITLVLGFGILRSARKG